MSEKTTTKKGAAVVAKINMDLYLIAIGVTSIIIAVVTRTLFFSLSFVFLSQVSSSVVVFFIFTCRPACAARAAVEVYVETVSATRLANLIRTHLGIPGLNGVLPSRNYFGCLVIIAIIRIVKVNVVPKGILGRRRAEIVRVDTNGDIALTSRLEVHVESRTVFAAF